MLALSLKKNCMLNFVQKKGLKKLYAEFCHPPIHTPNGGRTWEKKSSVGARFKKTVLCHQLQELYKNKKSLPCNCL